MEYRLRSQFGACLQLSLSVLVVNESSCFEVLDEVPNMTSCPTVRTKPARLTQCEIVHLRPRDSAIETGIHACTQGRLFDHPFPGPLASTRDTQAVRFDTLLGELIILTYTCFLEPREPATRQIEIAKRALSKGATAVAAIALGDTCASSTGALLSIFSNACLLLNN